MISLTSAENIIFYALFDQVGEQNIVIESIDHPKLFVADMTTNTEAF